MATQTKPAGPLAGPTQWRWIRQNLGTYAPVLVLLGLCLIVTIISPNFISVRNLIRLANSAAIPLILGLGVTFIIIMGSIDLSIEGVVSLTAVILSLLVMNGFNDNNLGLWAVPIVLALGAGVGLVNGVIHVFLRIPSFMVTLGMWFVGVGLANAILGGITVRITDKAIRGFALDRYLDIPVAVWIALLAFIVAYIIQKYTRLGRYMYALGGGEDLATLSGINFRRVRIILFTLAGAFFGLGGVLAAAQQGAGFSLIGQGRLFTAITAVVVGGTALWGGSGGVVQTLVGVLIVMVLANGMVLMGISPFVQQIVQGILIIIAVALSVKRVRLGIVK